MVDVGDTVAADPKIPPGFQVYVLAPVTDKVEEDPEQIIVGVATGETVGS